jgi:serine/threonine protein kinase
MDHNTHSNGAEGEPGDADDREARLLERYWQDLCQGRRPSQQAWLETHAGGDPELRGALSVLEIINADSKGRSRGCDRRPAELNVPPADLAGCATDQEPPAPLLRNGDQLEGGEFRILTRIDSGGMGEVYLAWQRSRHRQVALKLNRDPAIERRFQREIDIHYQLRGHQHIVVARDSKLHEGRAYLVMDYVPGTDLKRFVEKYGPLHWLEACSYILQAARGLEHAHALGIIHRDIKPSNLIRDAQDPGRSIKIIDWGLALCKDDALPQRDRDATQPGTLLGTIGFISPEQVEDPSNVGPAGDLYSLGCTFYYLLTGKPLFVNLPPPREDPPTLPKDLGVPLAVEQVVGTLLRHEPADRYPSAHELVEALETILRAAPVPPPAGRPWWFWVAVLFVVIGTVGLGWPGLSRWLGPAEVGQSSISTPPATKTEPPVPAPFTAPALDRLDFYFDRGDGTKDTHHLVAAARGLAAASAEPLGRKDSFVIDGRFHRPTYWYVVWIDTSGVVDVLEASPDQRSDFRYPLAPRGRAYPDEEDPPGSHVILVVAGALPPDEAKVLLKERLGKIGKPPALHRGEPWHYPLVADGEPTRSGRFKQADPGNLWPSDYLADVQQRLRDFPAQPLHAFFLSTQR